MGFILGGIMRKKENARKKKQRCLAYNQEGKKSFEPWFMCFRNLIGQNTKATGLNVNANLNFQD